MWLYNSGRDPASLLSDWTASYSAAYTTVLINEEVAQLESRLGELRHRIAELQAQEETRRLALELEMERLAQEQAIFAAEQEASAIKAANTYSVYTTGEANLSSVAGRVIVASRSSLSLSAAIQSAKVALGTVVSSATAVGIGALLYSPSLGNGELPGTMLSLPADDLVPDLPETLSHLAASQSSLKIPFRI